MASRITWRSTDICEAFRYAATLFISSGMARTTITPDIGLITTLRPGSLPTMATSALLNSSQKSALLVMLTWLLCRPLVELPAVEVLVPVGAPEELSETEPEVTRKLDFPSRCPVR